MRRLAVLLVLAVLLIALTGGQSPAAAQSVCALTLRAGGDIGAALGQAQRDTAICLSRGTYPPFVVGRIAAGVSVRGAGEGTVIQASRGTAIAIGDAERFTLSDLIVRGGAPYGIHVEGARSLTLRALRVENADVALLATDGASVQLDNVSLDRARTVALVSRGATVSGTRLAVHEPGGAGIAAILDGSRLTLRDSSVDGGPGPAIFAGVPGCADVDPATLVVPQCFYDDLGGFVSDVRVSLTDVTMRDGAGPGLLLFPGVEAEVRTSAISGRALGGVFAWGARVRLTDSTVDDNGINGVELRAYPGAVDGYLRASGTIERTSVRGSRALGGGVLGNGVTVRNADIALHASLAAGNAGAGVALHAGARGAVTENDIVVNGGAGICYAVGAPVFEEGNALGGNGVDAVIACEG